MDSLLNCDCLYPETLAQLTDCVTANSQAQLIAGGTDLYPQWKSGSRKVPSMMISLLNVPELRVIKEVENTIEIGAAVTHYELTQSGLISASLPLISEAAATVGAKQIQMRGTIGGSVANASPAGDLAPPLMAYDGLVILVSSSGERRLPVKDFFTGYKELDLKSGEFIRSFIINKPLQKEESVFRKLGMRKAQAISKVMCALRYRKRGSVIDFCSLAFGSVGPVPLRLTDFEKWISGKDLSTLKKEEIEDMVSREISPIDDIRSTGEYRQWVSGRIVSHILCS